MSITRIGMTERATKINIHNGTVYFSGQVPNDVTTDIAAQTEDVLAKVDAILAEAGSSRDHMLSVTIFLRDIERDFASMNVVWNKWLENNERPARACVQANMAREAILIEVCVVAALRTE
jgi:enamine deaminase RidA (YjgF/YER057c/UK114 family)